VAFAALLTARGEGKKLARPFLQAELVSARF